MTDVSADLRARLDGLTRADRLHLRRRLSGLGKITDRAQRQATEEKIEQAIVAAENRVARRRAALPAELSYPVDLPITDHRQELLAAIREHQVVVVAGETGSGKSTQIPKLCLEAGRGAEGMIGHTQPRRIAARSIAERIAEETGTAVGGLVGYTVRFSDQVGDATLVKVMTDGILLAEIQRDRRLDRYDTLIIDEAHERSLNIDFLLGYLKRLLPKRPDLRVIITSATIDTDRFSAHFADAPVIEVSGRSYPVEVRYRPLEGPDDPEPRDQPQGICDAVMELSAERRGDILVFCSGEREIRDAAEALAELDLRDTEILPLYARLSAAEQHRVFEPHRRRRIVLATNVAETSLTVPGIDAVVDPGTARISRYSRRTKVQQLPIEPISQASANQRAGRCGRLGPGVCIRLYTKDDFESRPEFTEPEIQRTNLASVILQMAALGLGDIERFPFVDPPDTRTIRDGIALLEELGAVEPAHLGTKGWLTELGRRLARIPLDPRLSRMIIEADRHAGLREVLVIVAALAIQDPRERPTGKEQPADQLHARFVDPASDLLGWLNLWNFIRTERRARTSASFRRMCRDEFLNYRRVREWQDLHAQLRDVTSELGLSINRRPAEPDAIHQSVLAGLLSQIGMKDPDGYEYRGARGARFSIAPGSALFKAAPRWLMAAELVETTRVWARGIAPVTTDWVERTGEHLLRRSYSDPWWDADKGAAVANETVTIYGLPLVEARPILYGRVDPEAARELFIRHALVWDEWESPHAFSEHNRAAVAEVHALEARTRRSDLLVDDDSLFGFFDHRIPADITTVRHFDRWWKTTRREQPHLLDLSPDDVIDRTAGPIPTEAFPEEWHHGDVALPLQYEFDPGGPADGVTVEIPLAALDRLDPAVFEWHVPGLRLELVTALIRSLPKQLRKQFAPIPDTARRILDDLEPADTGLLATLRRELARRSGSVIPVDAFDLEALPAHLRPRFRVVGEAGDVLAEGSDLAQIRARMTEEAGAVIGSAEHELEQSGLTSWSIGSLPRSILVEGPARSVHAYPALVDEGDSVGVRLFGTREQQAEAMWEGTRRLLTLHLPPAARLLRPLLTDEVKVALAISPYAGPARWMDDCVACALEQIVADAGGPAWDGVAFDTLLSSARDRLYEQSTTVAQSSLRVLIRLRAVRLLIAETSAVWARDAVADVKRQLQRLVYPGFIAAVGATRLDDLERYLAAAEHRLERLADDLDRDHRHMRTVRALEDEHDRMVDSLPLTPEIIEIGWMLQELRVSLFAQTVGARGAVSEKRIRRSLRDAALGVPS